MATIGRAESEPSTRGWLAQLITRRIPGLDVAAIVEQLSDVAGSAGMVA